MADLKSRQDELKHRLTHAEQLNLTRVYKMVRRGATSEEIADRFGIGRTVLYKRIHEDPELADIIRKGRANLKISLRRWQVKLAESGNPAMQIWLGKQLLGQKETVTIQGDAANPLELTVSSAAELLAAKIKQLAVRAGEIDDAIDIEPGRANGVAPLRREIEAIKEPDPGTI